MRSKREIPLSTLLSDDQQPTPCSGECARQVQGYWAVYYFSDCQRFSHHQQAQQTVTAAHLKTPHLYLVALVLGVQKSSYDTSSKKNQPLERVSILINFLLVFSVLCRKLHF